MITGLLLLAAVGAGLVCRRAVAAQLRVFLAWEASPVNLAVARIVVFGLLVVAVLWERPWWFAGLPPALLSPPPGAGWLLAVPLSAVVVGAASALTIGCAVAAMMGWHTRTAAAAATLGALYVLGIPQLWGKVDHDNNLIWFGSILAASPCGDALSIDTRSRERPGPERAYGFPLRVMGLLLGVVYFFPGLWKAGVGDAWWLSDNLQRQVRLRWLQAGMLPPFAVHNPLLLHVAALGTIAFELSFLWLILWPRTRKLAIAGGLGFHAGSAVVMGINFWPVWPCYVVLVDWARGAERGKGVLPRPGLRAVAGVVLVGALSAGALRINSWPFAEYPAFAFVAPATSPIARAVCVDNLGAVVPSDRAVGRMRARMESSRWAVLLDRVRAAPQLDGALLRALTREDSTLARAATLRVE